MRQTSMCGNSSPEELLHKYADTVYKIAFSRTKNSADADDIMQEVFLRYIRSEVSFENEEHEKAWFIRTTVNCSINLLSSAWFKRTDALEANQDELVTEMKENSEVYYAVMELPEKYRTVIHLFYYEDMSVANIASVLEKKESTIKSLLHRARTLLKEKLQQGLNF